MADFGEILKGRGEICRQRANLPIQYRYRRGQINPLATNFDLRQGDAVNEGTPWRSQRYQSQTFLPLMLLVMPLHPLAVFMVTNHMMLRNAIGHSGYEIFPAGRDRRPMFDWMTNVTHHDLHHAQAGWNFGLYFTWRDRWMGTEHPNYLARFGDASGPDPAPPARDARA